MNGSLEDEGPSPRKRRTGNAIGGAGVGHVKNELKKIDPHRSYLYRQLSERGVFQLGFKTQCPLCRRASWYNVKDLGPELTCPLCHEVISALAAVDSDSGGTWHLKTAGPFSVGRHADGSFCVLLTHNVFEENSLLQTTPVLSFKAHSRFGREIEADYAMLWRDQSYGETEEGVLFAECKSYGLFQSKDFARMKLLAKEFPGAILTFSTFRRKLTAREIKALTALAKAGRKYWKAERPINPVLILTGNELFGFLGPPSVWKELAVANWIKNSYKLLDICAASQSIYLNLPHWADHWHQHFEKRNARRALRRRSITQSDA